MARTNSLNNYLTDIATAIKTKKNDETPINASKFDEEIANLPTGGGADEYFGGSKPKTGGTNFINHFITKIPMIDASQETVMIEAFINCSSLKTIPFLNTSNVKDMNSMFSGCSSLETIPLLDTPKVTDMNSMFKRCNSLIEVPPLNASSSTSVAYMFTGCSNLTTLGGLINVGEALPTTTSANNYAYKLDLSSCTKLTHDSLMNVINNLYDIKSKGCNTQQLKLGTTNKNKLTAEEIAIATGRGWSVS